MSSVKKLKKQMETRTYRQQLTLLALANAALQVIWDRQIGVEYRAEVREAIVQFKQTLRYFPWDVKRGMNKIEIKKSLRRLSPVLDDESVLCSGVTFVGIAQTIMEDLSAKITKVEDKLQVELAVEALRTVSNLFDPDGDQYEAYDQIETVLVATYKEIGFKGGKHETVSPDTRSSPA